MEREFKRFHIVTYGCQMNVYDSNILKEVLINKGFIYSEDIKDTDIIIINGCSVRKHAEERAIGRFLNLKKNGIKVGFAGCLGKNLKQRGFRDADFLIGPDDYRNTFQEINEAICKNDEFETYDDILPEQKGVSAYIAITRGCNNFCSYCIVPYLRGPLRSRPYQSILKEINKLKEQNVKEVILIGQNVNEYKYDSVNFSGLLGMVKDTGIKMISFLTSHPKDIDLNIFRLMIENKNIVRYLHLPVQSGSNKILKMMNRGYTRDYYIQLINKIREIVPDITITTDILVGFPGEEEDDFENTLNLIKEINFDFAFMFRYSPRENTLSSLMDEKIDDDEKKRRLNEIIKTQYRITKEKAISMLGKEERCIAMTEAKKNGILCKSWTGKNIIVNENVKTGEELLVKIVDIKGNTLIGKIVKKEE